MFNKDFYPTPPEVIDLMMSGYDVLGKVVLEPSAGNGNIIEWLKDNGAADVLCCEIHPDLQKIASQKARLLAADFLTVTSEQISHIDMILMNPPFSADETHILHAYEIAPAGCQIIALCNAETVNKSYVSWKRQQLKTLIDSFGSFANLGDVFSDAERTTGATIGLVRLAKPGTAQRDEFEGFFIEPDPEEVQQDGMQRYNSVRDLVNRYVQAVKIFDKQLAAGLEMQRMIGGFFSAKLAFSATADQAPIQREEFKKELQKSAWMHVFEKSGLDKYATKGLKEDINRFVEQQTSIPFTMRNVYKMLEVVVGTTASRMDRALVEVFDKMTQHYDENRYGIEGWKTNSHYLLNRRFIMPNLIRVGWSGEVRESDYSGGNVELLQDFVKALCFITGKRYEMIPVFRMFLVEPYMVADAAGELIPSGGAGWRTIYSDSDPARLKSVVAGHPGSRIIGEPIEWGKWIEWGFFRFRAYKKGTCHLEFLDENVWALFNQHIARIKGYPLYEYRPKSKRKAA